MIKNVLTVIVQFIAAWILGFAVPWFLGIANGLELIAIPIGMALGVWLAGLIAYPANKKQFIFALLVAAIGAVILAIPNIAFGFIGLLLPLIGAFAGYYYYQSELRMSERIHRHLRTRWPSPINEPPERNKNAR